MKAPVFLKDPQCVCNYAKTSFVVECTGDGKITEQALETLLVCHDVADCSDGRSLVIRACADVDPQVLNCGFF
jgi:hypothetical protein